MNNTNQNSADSPLNAAKTLNSESVHNHTAKLEKAILSAFVPWLGDLKTNNQALVNAQHYVIETAKNQLEVYQAVSSKIPSREDVPIMAGSIVGFTGNLIDQFTVLEAITDELSKQITDLTKERDSALEALEKVNKGGEE